MKMLGAACALAVIAGAVGCGGGHYGYAYGTTAPNSYYYSAPYGKYGYQYDRYGRPYGRSDYVPYSPGYGSRSTTVRPRTYDYGYGYQYGPRRY